MSVAEEIQASIRDYFSGERARIRISISAVRFVGLLVLIYLAITIRGSVTQGTLSFLNLTNFFQVILLFLIAILLMLFTYIGQLIGLLFNFLAVLIPSVSISDGFATGLAYMMRAFFRFVLFNNFNLNIDGLDLDAYLGSGSNPLGPLAYLVLYSSRQVYEPIVVAGLLTLSYYLMILTGLNFLIKGNISQSGIAFGLSQFIIGFGYLNQLVNGLTLDATSISSLLSSSLFQLGFISYIYFEFSLQTGYLNKISNPALERQKRVNNQLNRLNSFNLGISKSPETTLRRSEEEEGEQGNVTLSAGTGSTGRKFGAEALVFLLDSAKDSLFKGEEGEKEKNLGRLKRYYDGLARHDKKINSKLGGTSGTFNPVMTIAVVMTMMVIRLLILVFMSFMVLNADRFFSFISYPDTITNSIEFTQPESIIIVLIPVIFLIIGLSYIVNQGQSLLIKATELIIEESEIQKLLKKGKAISSREEYEKLMKEKASETPPEKGKEKARKKRIKSKSNK